MQLIYHAVQFCYRLQLTILPKNEKKRKEKKRWQSESFAESLPLHRPQRNRTAYTIYIYTPGYKGDVWYGIGLMVTGYQTHISWNPLVSWRGHCCGLELCFDKKRALKKNKWKWFPSCFFFFFPFFPLWLCSLQWSQYWRSFGQDWRRLLLFQPSDVASVLWWHVGRAKELLDRQPTHVWTVKPLRWLSEAKSSACWCTPLAVTPLGGSTQ